MTLKILTNFNFSKYFIIKILFIKCVNFNNHIKFSIKLLKYIKFDLYKNWIWFKSNYIDIIWINLYLQ
jgi:hypothetical protein